MSLPAPAGTALGPTAAGNLALRGSTAIRAGRVVCCPAPLRMTKVGGWGTALALQARAFDGVKRSLATDRPSSP